MRRNKKAYEADLSRLNDAIWRFTNHAHREMVTAVDRACGGASLTEVEREAAKHSEEARKAWIEASSLARSIWSDVRKQTREKR